MDNDRLAEIRTIFEAALQLEPEARPAYVEQASGGDPEIARSVQALLAGGTLSAAEADLGPEPRNPVDDPFSVSLPKILGPYHLVELIGEGGMGDVWVASQRAPVRRDVAIKIIKLGMNTREVLARFETERQALAVMDHPNIAKILDGGATEAGRPYFVMELVKGVPVTEYCDTYRLDLRDRIKLVLTMCHGVQHAHHKGVIHRDIKPSNLLVAVKEDRPELKIIDFGLAKAVGTPFSSTTLHTGHGEMLGTPAYMSPEQANPGGMDVDTRTDVYSLGIVLYELLAGTRPYTARQVRGLTILNTLHDQPTPRPSTKFWELDDRSEIARRRSTTQNELRRRLRNDLDWIILKATQLDRTRRYETATALAGDLERYLDDQPILARPPSARYRAAKFVRRNAVTVAATVAVIAALTGGLIVSLQALRAAHAARDRAALEARASEALAQALTLVLSPRRGTSSISDASGGAAENANLVLDPGLHLLRNAAATLTDVPDDVKPRLNRLFARAFLERGLTQQALDLYEENVALLSAEADSPLQQHWAQAELLFARSASGRTEDMAEAIRGLRDSLIPQLREHAGEMPEAVAQVHLDLGDIYMEADSLAAAEDQYRAALRFLQAAGGPRTRQLHDALWLVGGRSYEQGRYDAAWTAWEEALAVLVELDGTQAERARVIDAMAEADLERARELRGSSGSVRCRQCDTLLQRAVSLKQEAVDQLTAHDLLDERARLSGAFGVRLDYLVRGGAFRGSPPLDPSHARVFLRQAIEAVEGNSDSQVAVPTVELWFGRLEASLRTDGLVAEAEGITNRRAAYASTRREAGS